MFTEAALALWPGSTVFGVDQSGATWDAACAQLNKLDFDGRWERVCIGVHSTTSILPSGLDLVIGADLGSWICESHFEKVLNSLKPGGRFAFYDPDKKISSSNDLQSGLAGVIDAPHEWYFGQKAGIEKTVTVRTIDSLRVGESTSFIHRFEMEDLRSFTQLSGDWNPLHWNDDYARSLGFEKRVVFGLLTTTLISRLIGVNLPGMYSLIREVTAQFPSPLYCGENIHVEGTVEKLDIEKRIMSVKVVAKKDDGKKVLRAKAQVSLPNLQGDWNLHFGKEAPRRNV